MKIRHALVLAAAVVMPLAVASPAGAAADPYQQCKDGGHVNYVDPATGQPFSNQGQCVSHVARGGDLDPVAPVYVFTRATGFPFDGDYVWCHTYVDGVFVGTFGAGYTLSDGTSGPGYVFPDGTAVAC